MNDVETEMKSSLHTITKEAVYHYAETKRIDWTFENLQSVVLAASQIWWTWEVAVILHLLQISFNSSIVCRSSPPQFLFMKG